MSDQPIIMQIILTAIALLGIERIVSRLRARAMGLGIVGVWIIGTIVFLVFVWKPDLATQLSQRIGVGRGVDAAIYISIAVLFYTTLRVLLRFERQENMISKLVSEIALIKHDIEHKK